MSGARPHFTLWTQTWTCVVCAILACIFWFVAAPLHSHAQGFFFPSVVLCLGTWIAAFYMAYDLRNGIESERWPAAEIELYRTVFRSYWMTTFIFAIPIVFIVLVCIHLIMGHHSPFLSSYGLMMFSNVFTQLGAAARPPRSQLPTEHMNLTDTAPLISSHWGER